MIDPMIKEASLPQRRWGFCASVFLIVTLLSCGDTSPHANGHSAACHSVASAPGIGPALNDIAGTERALVGGTTTLADTSYLRAAILEPSEHISLGFEATMPLYELSYPQVDALVAYLNHLGGVSPELDE